MSKEQRKQLSGSKVIAVPIMVTFDPDDWFLSSFDISSLFTNALLAEAIQICADTL